MSSYRQNDDNTPGQDSFLDIVSNLVGILIILVMVIGVQAKNAIVDARSRQAQERRQESDSREAQAVLRRQQEAVVSVALDIERLEHQSQQRLVEIAYRKRERDKLLAAIKAEEAALAQLSERLEDEQREQVELAADVAKRREEYEDLRRQREAIEQQQQPVHVIKHVPTPLAQTVFGNEAHLRLKDGRVAYVPLEDLVERFKEEARRNAWKLKDAPTYTDVVGPFDGFRLKYTLRRVTRAVQTRQGAAMQERVELDHFELIPVEDTMGEPVDVSLHPTSDLMSALARYPANKTVVTVWVYPDSFSAFRQLKDALAAKGYLVAGRPLPFDQHISGSPNGTRSAAQ